MQSNVMNCQKLNCLLFTAVALKEVNVVDVVFVVVFFGGKLKFGIVSHIYLLVLVLRKKNQPSAAVMRKTEATNMPESNLVN